MIVVSHDREFLTGLTDKVFAFSDKGIIAYNGDIVEFLRSSKLQTLDDLQKNRNTGKKQKEENLSPQKKKYEERKVLTKEKNKLASKIKKLESEIADFESDLSLINEKIAASPTYQADLINQYEEIQKKLERGMKQWENHSLSLEKLN